MGRRGSKGAMEGGVMEEREGEKEGIRRGDEGGEGGEQSHTFPPSSHDTE